MTVKVHVAMDPATAGIAAASVILGLAEQKQDGVLGLATGSSPLPLYAALIPHRARLAGFSFCALDEYVGLPAEHPNSYRSFLIREVLQPLGHCSSRLIIPDSNPADPQSEARSFGARLSERGGIDLQILGIGRNGHLGFNEPPADFGSRCRVVTLADSTRADNARFFSHPELVPLEAITQGLADIREARQLVLVANGNEKSEAVCRALTGPVSQEFPASMIQLHPCATVVLDAAAASALPAGDASGRWQIL